MAEQNSLNRKAGGGGGAERSVQGSTESMPQWSDNFILPLFKSLPPPKHAAVGTRLRTHRLWKTVSKLQQNVREGLVVREGLRAFSDSLSGRHHYEQ